MVGWDQFSDQPLHMRDKKKKFHIRKKYIDDLIISFFTILLFYPLAFLRYLFPFKKIKNQRIDDIFGMGVNFDKEPLKTLELVDELGVKKLLIRIRLAQIDKLNDIEDFVKSFKNKEIIFVIIQNRENIENDILLEENIKKIFFTFGKYGKKFVIGNAVNRIKWGFVLPKEYLLFYKKVQKIRDSYFTDIKLFGPSVIDFEFHTLIRLMFNCFKIRYDGISSLLYVDRRGAPENKQGIFNLRDKIFLLRSITNLSPLAKQKDIYITETNWPISNTGKYAPTSNAERVNEELYASYLIRYYLLGISTTQIKTIFWHQLIAVGYGLVDNKEALRKREAFFAYKFMLFILKNSFFIKFYQRNGIYFCIFKKGKKIIKALWCNNEEKKITLQKKEIAFDMVGNRIFLQEIAINDKVTYIENTN